MTAISVRDRYWLYVVVDCVKNPVLCRVQVPCVQAGSEDSAASVNFGDILGKRSATDSPGKQKHA
jgi:hypothetical protein